MSRRLDDPYLEWSELTGFAGHVALRDGKTDTVPVLLQVTPKQRRSLDTFEGLNIPEAWAEGGRTYLTGVAKQGRLRDLQEKVTRMEFALPVDAWRDGSEVPQSAEADEPVVFAVVDRGCAFLNAAFGKSQDGAMPLRGSKHQTRLIGVWDQGRHALGDIWRTPKDFGYGRELGRDKVDWLLEGLVGKGPEAEARVYGELDYLQDTARPNGPSVLRESAHGTHVLDTGAGCIERNPPRSSAKPAQADAASRMPLIFVDAPGLAPDDTTGAATGAYLLDALRYIRLRAGSKAQVVVNISLGAFAGPHDGSSMVEQAIDDFLDRDGKMQVTVAAGNAALERWHASGDLDPDDEVELRWRTIPGDPTDSFVEIWTGDHARSLEVQVTPPGGAATNWIAMSELEVEPLANADYDLMAALIGCARPTGTMALLAVAPSAAGRRAAPPGPWRIALRNRGSRGSIPFDAWIQRDEPAWSSGPTVQSYFESASAGVKVGGQGGLSSLATGSNTIVVGAASAEDGREAFYSSRGSPPRDGGDTRDIDVVAPADESASEIGLLAAGVLSYTRVRMGGTSVAAPVVARRLCNHLAGPGGSGASKDAQAQADETPPQAADQKAAFLASLRKAPRPRDPKGPEPVAAAWPEGMAGPPASQ